MFKVYYSSWDYNLSDAIRENAWEYITNSLEDANNWIEQHDTLGPEESYQIYITNS